MFQEEARITNAPAKQAIIPWVSPWHQAMLVLFYSNLRGSHPLILKRGGLETSDQRPISLNFKTKSVAFFQIFLSSQKKNIPKYLRYILRRKKCFSLTRPRGPSRDVRLYATLKKPHFQVSRRPLVKELIPNTVLWWHNFPKKGGAIFSKIVETLGFGPAYCG